MDGEFFLGQARSVHPFQPADLKVGCEEMIHRTHEEVQELYSRALTTTCISHMSSKLTFKQPLSAPLQLFCFWPPFIFLPSA